MFSPHFLLFQFHSCLFIFVCFSHHSCFTRWVVKYK
jgi:hypothetical protein